MNFLRLNKFAFKHLEVTVVAVASLIYIFAGSTITVTEVEGSAIRIPPSSIEEHQDKKKAEAKEIEARIAEAKKQEEVKRRAKLIDQRIFDALKNDQDFYELSLNVSHAQAKYIGATDNKATWGKFLNLLDGDFNASLEGIDGTQKAQVLLANAAWFSMAEWQLEQKNNIERGVMNLKTQEDRNYYVSILHDSYKRATEAKFQGSHSDWETVIKSQDVILTGLVNKSFSMPIERSKAVLAFAVWNDVHSHQLGANLLQKSYEDAKKAGFSNGMHAWLGVLKSRAEDPHATAAWPTANEFIGADAWNSLYFPSLNNLTLNYDSNSQRELVKIRKKFNSKAGKNLNCAFC